MDKTRTILQGWMFALGFAAICGFLIWILIPANKPIKIRSLSKSEIRKLCDENSEAETAYYVLSAGEYQVLGRFSENTVKVNSVKHYEDLTYACYTVQFLDKNGEPVVMAARTLADDNDLENKAGDVSGKLITMKDDLAARQTQSYDGELELEKIILNEVRDADSKVKDIALKVGLGSIFLLLALCVIYRIKA